MSQHDFEIANQGFPSFRSDLNSGLQALASNSAGATAPSTTYAYQMWYDSTANLLKMRNADDDAWITLAYFDQTNDEWEVRSAVIQAVDAAGVTIKNDGGTTLIEAKDDGSVVFRTDDVTITSAGHVLIQTTATNMGSSSSGEGFNFLAGESFRAQRESGPPIIANRVTDDGSVVEIRKNGSAVGSISTYGSSVVIGGGDCGVRFIDATNSIAPANVSGNTDIDDSINLGYSTRRFKNLYLSGGVYLGGTGAANYLDDYEEGTWTPAYSTSGGSFTYDTATQGQYTKIGNVVTVYFRIYTMSATVGTGNVSITGLPFAENIPSGSSGGSIGDCRRFGGDNPTEMGVVGTEIPLWYRVSASGENTRLQASDLDTGTVDNLIDGQITYITS